MSRSLMLPLFAVLAWSFLPACSPAQDGIRDGSKADTEGPFKKIDSKFKEFVDGKEKPSPNDPLFDVAAKYYAYRLQWPTFKDDPVELAKYVSGFEKDVIVPLLRPEASKTNQEARNLVGRTMAVRYAEVLNLPLAENRLSVMHAALSLPSLARLKQDDVGDLLTRLVADKDKHDAVKLYAFKSMKEYFPATMLFNEDDFTIKSLLARARRDLARIEALIQFIETKRPSMSNQGTEAEKALRQQELDAVRYVRREAIHALAQAQVPALMTPLKKKGVAPLADFIKESKGEGVVAATLMRVIVKGGLEPEASLAEKVEAAIGLCHLKCNKMPEYQPEMGVHMVGRALDEYLRTYGTDYLSLKQGVKVPQIAWRIQSERLRLALEELEKNCKDTSAKAAAERIARDGSNNLSLVRDYRPLTNANALRAVADLVRPKTNALFKGVPGPMIDPGE